MIHELLLSRTETASGSHPCCVVSVTYHRPSYFHGGSHAADQDRHCVCGVLAKKNARRTKFTGSFTGSWLKRLASAVQLRPWPPHFKVVSGIESCLPSPLS